MSKIEDALNKAKKEHASSKVPREITKSTNDNDLKQVLVPIKNEISLAHSYKESSAKEIARMKQESELTSDELSRLKIIYSSMEDNKIANTYRDLRTKLLKSSKGKNFIVMITSVSQGSFSSTTALNLSVAFSFDESKTSLLIDCNLYDPQLDGILNTQDNIGITDYLVDETIEVSAIVHQSGIKRLRVIPAGTKRESATEYFTSLRMKELTSSLIERYPDRFIFIESSPIIDSADTRILSEHCDFVILVVPYGSSTIEKVQEAAEAIGKDKLLGVVFNDVPKLPSLKSLKLKYN